MYPRRVPYHLLANDLQRMPSKPPLYAAWQGIADPLSGHVHVAPRGVAGPVVIDLDTDGGGPDEEGCREISAELAAAITSDPGAYYVNLHNAGVQAGAIRGQLK